MRRAHAAVLSSAMEWPAIMQAFKERLEDNDVPTEDDVWSVSESAHTSATKFPRSRTLIRNSR